MASDNPVISDRAVLTELIMKYESYPNLWNTTHNLYGNIEAKKRAFADLLEIYQLLDDTANIDTLKKKLENLRTAYRRERKKVMLNKYHIPCLWYYKLMSFLDQGNVIPEYQPQNDEYESVSYSEVSQRDDSETEEISQTITLSPTKEEAVCLPEKSTNVIEELTETDAFGRTVGLQLTELSCTQKIIAEKLISDVVYNARLDKLTTKTSLTYLKEGFL